MQHKVDRLKSEADEFQQRLQKRRALEQRLRTEIRRLQGTSAMASVVNNAVDENMLSNIGNVVNETQHVLLEQHEHLEAVLLELVELQKRLLDAAVHLEVPEVAGEIRMAAISKDIEAQRRLAAGHMGK